MATSIPAKSTRFERINRKSSVFSEVLVRRCSMARDCGPATLNPQTASVRLSKLTPSGRGTASKKRL